MLYQELLIHKLQIGSSVCALKAMKFPVRNK